jgi:integral membrane sensor domain MASE1
MVQVGVLAARYYFTVLFTARFHPLVISYLFLLALRVSSTRFLSSISLVVLLAPFCVFVAVPNSVLRDDSLSIASRSWPS